ncbi:MAG: glycosyltransferase [Polyangiaceae bacterium]|nr:glycosyltransferase [Polyangiaceae bacterium]
MDESPGSSSVLAPLRLCEFAMDETLRRKLRKLVTRPGEFFVDAFRKRLPALPMPRLAKAKKQLRGRYSYSVVAAVHGVEPYLNEFFRSLEAQTLDFAGNIEVIAVDDGSLDGSAAVIERWRRRYPRNIRCVHKDNGGQASARNAGMPMATGDWITFTDPDDLVDPRYFEHVDRFLSSSAAQKVRLLSCNLLVYTEATRRISDTHHLRYRFERGDRIVGASSPGRHLQLSASSAFFSREILSATGLRFDERIRPTFEDGHFVGRYLLSTQDHDIGICSHAKYLYRKRRAKNSTLDGSWTDPRRFGAAIEFGAEALLRTARETLGSVPAWTQRMVLYDLAWTFKRLVDHPERATFLGPTEVAAFKATLRRVFSYIDAKTILDFELAGVSWLHKVGWLGLCGHALPFQSVHAVEHNATAGIVKFVYFFAGEQPREAFVVGGQEVLPASAENRVFDFLGDDYVTERTIWLPLRDEHETLELRLDGQRAHVSVRGKNRGDALTVGELLDEVGRNKGHGFAEVTGSKWIA